jgi:acyl dehydratase
MSNPRELSRPPRLAGLYLRALLGAGRRGDHAGRSERAGWSGDRVAGLPELRVRTAVRAERLARYRRVCGFPDDEGGAVPATFPHLLAFPLALRLMTSPAFPAPVLGLVHLRNSVTQYRPVEVGEPLTVRAWVGEFGDHDRGTTVELLAEATAVGTPVWYEQSIYLHRHQKSGPTNRPGEEVGSGPTHPPGEVWPVPAGTGRRYAAVSGDRNPIHLSAASARLFGFRTAIAHGMWAKARCLAALDGGGGAGLPRRFRIDVAFRRPVPVPGAVAFHRDGDAFTLTGPDGTPVHLTGAVESAC